MASSSDTNESESGVEGIHPFLYEPMASSSNSEEGSDSDEDLSPRLLNLNW